MSTGAERATKGRSRPAGEERSPAGRGSRLPSGLPTEARAPTAVLGRDAAYRRLLAVADIMAAALALAAVVSVAPSVRLSAEGLLTLPAIVLIAKLLGLYDRDDVLLRKTTLEETPQLFQLATLFALGAWLTAPLIFAGPLNRSNVVELLITLLVLLSAGRSVARLLARRLSPPERCLFIGEEDEARRFTRKLEGARGVKAEVVAHLATGDSEPWTPGDPDSAQAVRLRELIASAQVHRVVLAPSTERPAETLELVRLLKAEGVRVSLLPHLFEAVGSSVVFDDVEGLTLLGVRRVALTRSSYALKRASDLAGASAALVLTAPLSAVIALLVKLDSGETLLFRQERIGRGGTPFRMYKFRTMHEDAEAGKAALRHRNEGASGFFKITDDPRVTRVGRWLRRTSLDELPQLVNVLKGEMSLVGPRPLIHEEDRQILGWQRRRLDLTPGMTGPWQILGSSRIPLREMVAIDYLYVANWSLWNDVKILLRTLLYMARRDSR